MSTDSFKSKPKSAESYDLFLGFDGGVLGENVGSSFYSLSATQIEWARHFAVSPGLASFCFNLQYLQSRVDVYLSVCKDL